MSGSARGPDAGPGRRTPLALRLIATGLCTGYIPWGTGTFGSLAGLLLLLALPGATEIRVTALLIPAVFLLGVYAAGRVAGEEGHRLTKSAAAAKALFQPAGSAHPDPSIVVIDEIVGMWVALAGVPPGAIAAIAAFLLFRIFDVLKPEPARSVEHLPGGWGIMLDDVVAGLYANAATRVLLLLIPLFHSPGGGG